MKQIDTIDVGFSNFINVEHILGVSRPDSAPIKRMVREAKEAGRYFDYTQGKKTRSIVIVQCGDHYILIGTSILTSTLAGRIKKAQQQQLVKETISEDEIIKTSL